MIDMNEIDSVIPVGVQPMLAQFNSVSKAYVNCIAMVPREFLNTDHFTYVEVQIDPTTQVIVGTLDNFDVVDIAATKTRIFETQVNNQCKDKIYKRFQLEVQLDIIRGVLAEVCEKLGHENEAFLDMNDYIDGVKRANKILKQSYINNPDFEFVTIAQEQAEHEAKLDGGLHEVMGPANLVSLGLTLDK